MHGQKRSEYKSRLLQPETATKLATKAQQWNHLSHELLTQRRRLFGPPPSVAAAGSAGDGSGNPAKPSPEILLTLTEKMLSVNPDPSHLWNIRREMLLYVPAAATSNADEPEDISSNTFSLDIQPELTLTAHCLQRNPKSYSAWFHRKWSLVYFLTHPAAAIDDDERSSSTPALDGTKQHLNDMKSKLQSELDLCAQFLQMDERNFHCWNYRRFVVALIGSCGGGGIESSIEDSGIAFKEDMRLFNGSWSSFLNLSKISMGAQLSQTAIAAVGMVPSDKHQSNEDAFVAKSITSLSQQELDEIITNEWDFTSSKIQANFSNGSAFHYRSKLLPLVLETRLMSSASGDSEEGDNNSPSASERYDSILSLAREEWENILLNAIFTEPDDQTPWWYHRFIVSWAKPSDDLDDDLVEEYEALLFEMADSLRDLLEVEKENDMSGNADSKDESKGAKCKWAYIGLHLVLTKLLQSKYMNEEEAADLRYEAGECLTELMRIDPNRIERYQNLAAENKGV